MNFQSLTNGASFYVIGTNGGLNVAVGVIKSKSAPYFPNMGSQFTPGAMNAQLVDITVNFNGQDRLVPGLPVNLEVAGRDAEIYTGNRDLAERIIDEKVAEAQKNLQNRPLWEKIIADGPQCKELINPDYAATRKQTETIEQLQARATSTEKELQEMKAQNAEMLKLLREALGGGGKGSKKGDS